jgi:hypothetical protein
MRLSDSSCSDHKVQQEKIGASAHFSAFHACVFVRIFVDPHTQNMWVNRPPAEKLRKLWCKCGAPANSTNHGTPNSALSRALTCHFSGADDGIRTRDPHLGKVMLYH